MLMAQSSRNPSASTTIHSQRDVSFGFLCGLELRLNPVMEVAECDEDKPQGSGEDAVAFRATIRYTLLDVLLAIYEFFGEPPFDRRYQRQVDEDEELWEKLRNRDAAEEEELEIVEPVILPAFNAEGDLPPGVHRATLSQVLERFGRGTARRRAVADRLNRIYQLAASTGQLARFFVFGSFITAKAEPNDVEVLLMEDGFDLAAVTGEAALVFQHMTADAYFGASVFWAKRSGAIGGEQAMIEYWQVRREGGRQGIVEIVGERS